MKNVNLQTILLLIIALGVGYLIGSQNLLTQKEQVPIPEKTVSDSDLFSKKQECQKYKNEIEKELESKNAYIAETNSQIHNSLDKLFYSPKIGSCLYVATDIMFTDNERTFETPTLVDALTGEILLSMIRDWREDDYHELRRKFEEMVEEYE